ncbi:MAG: DivIVA domain-containing protein [Ruminococcaceae bacterium]|nr:DivIVA domain-containing protein [Oscillospiraceae bacterium]
MHNDGIHTGDYIRSVKFEYAMRGYRVADVEMFLDEVANDVDKLIAQNRALNERVAALMKEQESGAKSTYTEPQHPEIPKVNNSDSIEQVQGILVSAQRFSDQIINEANEKAASILFEANSKAKEIDEKVASVLAAFEKDIAERKSNADAEISKMLTDAAVKSEGIITAAHDSVARQQMLFDKLKVEVSEFKKKLFDNHKQQLEILQKIPDSVPYDPEHAAKALEFKIDAEPDFRSFIPNVNFADNNIFSNESANTELVTEAPTSTANETDDNDDTDNAVDIVSEDTGATV